MTALADKIDDRRMTRSDAISNGGSLGRRVVGAGGALPDPCQCAPRASAKFAETGDGLRDFAEAYFRSLAHITMRGYR